MNLYCYLNAWIIKKGFWVRHKSMRKFQKVLRIEGEDFGERTFFLEPLGELNNRESFKAHKGDSIECRYKRIPYPDCPSETYAEFDL